MPDRDLILETRGLTREFGGFTAVNDVSLKIERGAIHALIGPNGAGKTTCFNLLTKFLEPTRGAILFKGSDITALNATRVAREGMVRSFQISAVFPELTVLQNVRVALQRQSGATLAFWRSGRALNALDERAHAVLGRVRLGASAGRPAGLLSYGQKRALELATTIALEPELVLLDEPTQGMGHEDVEHTMHLVKEIAQGRTVVMVEHNMKVVGAICDRITVLARGEILAEGSYESVSNDERVVSAYMGGRRRARSAAAEVAQ